MQLGIYMIGEIGQAHDGSLGLAHSYIDALATTGIDAVKFQIHIAEAESSVYEKFRTPFSFLDETRMEYWKRMEFTFEQWLGLKNHCEDKNLDFLATPCSVAAVDLLKKLGVQKFKIGSGDVNNLLLLQHVADTGSDIILSSGMSSTEELDRCIQFLSAWEIKLSLLQCTSSYPSHPEEWGLNMIGYFRDRYQIPIGFSDHSGNINACIAAASLGAEILEFHAVFDNRMFGPDATSSITIDQIKALSIGVREVEKALQNPVDKHKNQSFSYLKDLFEKSLAINKKLLSGHYFTLNDLETKKPNSMGIPAYQFKNIIGRQLNKNLEKWSFLTENDLN